MVAKNDWHAVVVNRNVPNRQNRHLISAAKLRLPFLRGKLAFVSRVAPKYPDPRSALAHPCHSRMRIEQELMLIQALASEAGDCV